MGNSKMGSINLQKVDAARIMRELKEWKTHPSGDVILTNWQQDEQFRALTVRDQIDQLLANPQVSSALASALNAASSANPELSESELAESSLKFFVTACEVNMTSAASHKKWTSMGTRSEQLEDLRSARNACRELQATLNRLAPLIRAGYRLECIEARSANPEFDARDLDDLPLHSANANRKSAVQLLPMLEQDLSSLAKLVERQLSRKRQSGGKAAEHYPLIDELSMAAIPLHTKDGDGWRPPVQLIFETILALRPDADLTEDTVRKRLIMPRKLVPENS